MATVLTLEEVRNNLQKQARLLNGVIKDINAHKAWQEQLFSTHEPPDSIVSLMQTGMDDLEIVSDRIGVDIGLVGTAIGASYLGGIESRIDTPHGFHHWNINNAGNFIETRNFNDIVVEQSYDSNIQVGDTLRLLDAEDELNNQDLVVLSLTTSKITFAAGTIFTDNTKDTRMHFQLVER